MDVTVFPSSSLLDSEPSSKPTIEVWTAAPSRIQGLVGPGQEDVAGLLDALEQPAVGASPDALGSQQARPSCPFVDNQGPGLFEPVADHVGLGGDTPLVHLEHGVHVVVTQVGAE